MHTFPYAVALNPATINALAVVGNFWDLLSTASVVIALALAAGLGLQRSVVITLRETRDDALTEAELMKNQRDEARQEVKAKDLALAAKDVLLQQKDSEITLLARTVTGEVHWQAISEMLDHHHETAEVHWKRVEVLCADLLAELQRREGSG